MIELFGTLAAALGAGFVSAWVPVVNAEAYVLALAATTSPTLGWTSVVGVAVGQTAGKQLMFVAARRGRSLNWRGLDRFGRTWRRRRRASSDGGVPAQVGTVADGGVSAEGGVPPDVGDTPGAARPGRRREPGPVRRRLADWGERGLLLLDRPWPAAGVLLAAASVGVPPLAVVSIAAGVRSTPALLVAVCTLVGRAARFAVMAAPVIWTASS